LISLLGYHLSLTGLGKEEMLKLVVLIHQKKDNKMVGLAERKNSP
jgi:hypothetical protein